MGRDNPSPLAARLQREESGWTLVELLAVIGISIIVGAAALMAIQTGQISSSKTSARQEALQQAEVALDRVTRETRQAVAVRLWSATYLDMKIPIRGSSGLRRVQYDCGTGSSCRRKDCGTVASSGTLAALGQTCSAGTWAPLVEGLDQVTFGAELQGATVSVPPARETVATSAVFDLVTVTMRIRLDDFGAGRQAAKGLDPVEIRGGVKLENVSAS